MNQMTPIPVAGSTVSRKTGAGSEALTQRAALRSELGYVQKRLVEAIDSMEGFNDAFRAFERGRLSKLYLANLHSLDPNYVRVCFSGDTMAGFMISGPEYGSLWLYWGYVFPEVRTPKMAMVFMRQYFEHWDNGRFHKVSNYTLPANRAAIAMTRRFGYRHVCDLPNHVMGQDFLLFERPLRKAIPGYDNGTNPGLGTRLLNRMRCLLGLI